MNTYYIGNFPVTDELYHYGILGQKWGIRRYQNPDGTLTAAGKERYGTDVTKLSKKEFNNQITASAHAGRLKRVAELNDKVQKEQENTKEFKEYTESLKNAKFYYNLNTGEMYARGQDKQHDELIKYRKLEYEKKGKEILKKYEEKMASVILQDLGYDDTERARNYLKTKIGLI